MHVEYSNHLTECNDVVLDYSSTFDKYIATGAGRGVGGSQPPTEPKIAPARLNGGRRLHRDGLGGSGWPGRPGPFKGRGWCASEQPIAGLRPAPISTQLGAGLGGAGGGGAVVHR